MDRKEALVHVVNCSKSFNGITVFADFDFDLYPGEIHCLCGENGAGKSTFIKILSGAYVPDGGDVYICGQKINGFEPSVPRKLGVQTIYQNQFLMENLTVAENIYMGDYDTKGAVLNVKKMNADAKVYLDELELNVKPSTKVNRLNVADRQTVQIAKALAHDAKILILDEPTASYGRKETENLMEIVRRLAKRGLGIIYISHHLDEVFELADTVTTLRDGRKISTYTKENLDKDQLIRDMVGRDTSLFYSREEVEKQDGMLEIKAVGKEGYVKPCSFTVQQGEIVGFGGLVGSGRSELMSLLFGSTKADTGEMTKNGENILPSDPTDAIKKGIFYIPEDRQKNGVFMGHSIGWNFGSAKMVQTKSQMVGQSGVNRDFKSFEERMRIKCVGSGQGIQFLSGGNQQKVVIAKWLYTDGDVYIFDEPTKGIDIGAKEDVYHLMIELAKAGKYIILVSSDMPELIAMSDKVCVMRNQEIIKTLTDKADFTEETILAYAIGQRGGDQDG